MSMAYNASQWTEPTTTLPFTTSLDTLDQTTAAIEVEDADDGS